MIRSVGVLGLLLVLAGCGGEPFEPIPGLPRSLSAGEIGVIAAANDFAPDLFLAAAAASDSVNVVVSPFSASMALGMTLMGARAETFDSMRAALRLGSVPDGDIAAAYNGLRTLLPGLDPRVELRVANAIWHENRFAVRPEFLAVNRDAFGAEVAGLAFEDPASVGVINDWVRNATNQRIPRLLDQLSSDEVLMLVNALYFKAPWTTAFDPQRTRDGTFRRQDGTTSQARFMTRAGDFRYYAEPTFEVAELPYAGGAWTMVLLVPREQAGAGAGPASPDHLAQHLRADAFRTIAENMHEDERAILTMPRFRLEHAAELDEPLAGLGMGIAFDDMRADFGGINPDVRLVITRVTQKTMIEVTEQGTEAAAATGVGVGVVSMPPEIRLDRPFLFAIRERFSGTILFVGRVGDPGHF